MATTRTRSTHSTAVPEISGELGGDLCRGEGCWGNKLSGGFVAIILLKKKPSPSGSEFKNHPDYRM